METVQKQENKQEKTQNIWDHIEEVEEILKREEELSDDELQKVKLLLDEVTQKTKVQEESLTSFFQDELYAKLKILFGDHPLFDEEVVQFTDSIELLIGGEKAFEEIGAQIDKAQTSIDITIFIWRNDKIGTTLAQKIIEAANRGVKIMIRKDRLGALFEHAEQGKKSFFHPQLDEAENIKREIIDTTYANEDEASEYEKKQEASPLLKGMLEHPNITIEADSVRNDHSKCWIFDDETIVTGGMNIGDEYSEKWHDYMVKMESKILAQKLKARVSGEDDFDTGSSVEFGINRVEEGMVKEKEIEPLTLALLEEAKTEIIIQMAYFGDPEITDMIIKKANEGIPVTIILPQNANVQNDLNKKVMQQILDETDGVVSVYFYPKMLHAKLIHVDGRKTFLGSANLNTKATEDLGEFNIIVDDKDCEFTLELKEQLQKDIKASTKHAPKEKIKYNSIKAYLEEKA